MVITDQMGALTARVRAEYREMPGLSLTAAQASRLLGIDRPVCEQVLPSLPAVADAFGLELQLVSDPGLERAYRVPGGTFGIWLAGVAGFLSCGFVLFIGFVPPGNTASGEELRYTRTMLAGYLLFTCPPFVFRALRRPNWQRPETEQELS